MARATASEVIRAPRQAVFELWTDYGSERRMDVFGGSLKAQRVLQREGNQLLVENEMEAGSRRYHDRRRYTLYPYERIVEEMVESDVLRGSVEYTFEELPEGTRVTIAYDLRASGIRNFLLAPLLGSYLKRIGDSLLFSVKTYFEPEEGGNEGQPA